ncbi:sugar ABC transporter substrate-binding protein [Deinococcus multiflagellatus]|uniref:sugar ABC transporter substrate-binding protein n=1 Tax=Deinococcus multiflagellatus TaxID=1656887 RepID=UPI001CCE37FA|nr:extracellular solute-binding protein [Deinococcus multiflagellatus]MBZ9712802.1 extracellular solute-binding protein [Deinococcus multiflagellatus]
MRRTLPTLLLLLAGTGQAVTLTVWTHYVGGDRDWLTLQTRAFTASTGHRVQILTVPFDELGPRWAAADRTGPDVVVGVPDEWLAAAAPLAAPLPAGPGGDPQGVRAFTVQGTLRGLPLTAEAVALVYNPRVIPRAPATWAELERVAAAEVQAGRLGLALDLTSAYTQAGVFQAYGASPFGPKGTSDLGLAAPGAVQAGTFLRELGKISGMVSGLNDRAALVAFGDGRLAMWVTGPWNLGRLQQTGRDVRSAPLPPLPGAAGPWQPFVGRQGVMVAARRPHQKEALALARALTTETSQVTLYRAGGRPPSSPAARAQVAQEVPALGGFDQAIRAGVPVPSVPEMAAVWGPWDQALRRLQTAPAQSVRAILDEAVRQIRAALTR